MAKCIYSGVTLNNNRPQDDATATVEHVIPWALGGSDGFTIGNVSKKWNNDLGSDVDAPLANTLPLAIKRHVLRLESQNGNIEPIVWRGRSPNGARGKMTIWPDGTHSIDFEPDVVRPPAGQGGRLSVSGTRDRVLPILEGMLRGMRKRGEAAYSLSGKLLTSLDDVLAESEQELISQVRFEVEHSNHEAWTRGMLKIILAGGCKVLGDGWAWSETAEAIRQHVIRGKDCWPTDRLRGYIVGEWDRTLRNAVGKTAEVRVRNQHTFAVLPSRRDGAGVALLPLFGGERVSEAVVDIGELPQSMVNALNRENNSGVVLGFRVDPATRATVPITFGEVNERNARYGPTNRRALAFLQDRTSR